MRTNVASLLYVKIKIRSLGYKGTEHVYKFYKMTDIVIDFLCCFPVKPSIIFRKQLNFNSGSCYMFYSVSFPFPSSAYLIYRITKKDTIQKIPAVNCSLIQAPNFNFKHAQYFQIAYIMSAFFIISKSFFCIEPVKYPININFATIYLFLKKILLTFLINYF